MPKKRYVPNVHYQEERAAVLYTVWTEARSKLGFDTEPVWELLDDRDRSAWLVIATEPMPAESTVFID